MDAETAYLFRHGLLRDAAYELQPPRERGRLHALAVELTEDIFTDDAERASMAEELADHCRRARTSLQSNELLPRERAYTLQAARQADQAFRNEDAERLFRAYLEIAEDTERVSALCTLSNICQRLAKPEAAEAAARDARRIAEAGPMPDRIQARRQLAEIIFPTGKADEALSELRQAYSFASIAKDALQRHRVAAAQSRILFFLGRLPSSIRLNRVCIGFFRSAGVRQDLTTARHSLGAALYGSGRYQDAVELLVETLADEGDGNPASRMHGLITLANTYEEMGRAQEAESAYLEAMRLAKQVGHRAMHGNVIGNYAILLHHLGRIEEATPLYHEAYQAHREAGLPASEAISLSNIAGLHRDRNEFEAAAALFADALEISRRAGSPRITGVIEGNLAGVQRELGRLEEARAHYESAMKSHRNASNQYFEAIHGADWAILELYAGNRVFANELWQRHMSSLRLLGDGREFDERVNEMHRACAERGLEVLETPAAANG